MDGVPGSQYQVLEELGSTLFSDQASSDGSYRIPTFSLVAELSELTVIQGGSFGVVYKAIERATGEIVAIKHVCTTKSGA